MQGDERRTLDVPVGLFALSLQIDGIGQTLVQQADRFPAILLRQVILGGVEASGIGTGLGRGAGAGTRRTRRRHVAGHAASSYMGRQATATVALVDWSRPRKVNRYYVFLQSTFGINSPGRFRMA